MGKGSRERPRDRKRFRRNWEAIFGRAQEVDFTGPLDTPSAATLTSLSNTNPRQREEDPHGNDS